MTLTTKVIVGAVAVLVALCFGYPFFLSDSDPTSELPLQNEQPVPQAKQETPLAGKNTNEPQPKQPEPITPRYYLSTPEQHDRISRQNQAIDPSQDGWETEKLASRARSLLKNLITLALQENGSSSQDLGQTLANDFSCTPLLPQQLSTVFQDETVTTSRGNPQVLSQTPPSIQGAGGLLNAMDDLLKPLRSTEQGSPNSFPTEGSSNRRTKTDHGHQHPRGIRECSARCGT